MTDNTTTSAWIDQDGNTIQVAIIRDYLTTEDTCPKCDGGLRIVVAKVQDTGDKLAQGDQVFRLECLTCGWTSEALPDPEA